MFKDPIKNTWITSGLFKETAGPNKSFILFTVEEARKLFVQSGDPTGVVFADEHLGGYQHWKALKDCNPLKPYIAEWEEELEVRIRSKQLGNIMKQADEGHFQAEKFLMDRGWEKRGAGRPSKEEVERETRVQSAIKNDYKADVARINK